MTVHLPRYIHRTFSKSVAVSEIHNVARYKNARHIWQLRTASRAILIYSMPSLVLSPLSPSLRRRRRRRTAGFPVFPVLYTASRQRGPLQVRDSTSAVKKLRSRSQLPVKKERTYGTSQQQESFSKISLSPMAWPTGARRRRQRKREGVGGGWARPLQQRLADRSVAAVVAAAEMLLKKKGGRREGRAGRMPKGRRRRLHKI